ncbi:HTH-type transcriptional repressor YvoA [Pigmentiphaga humi]|uniref:HTH-type transcriptional repressor YvoA n=1 Tax=Pigmentiphaga humi TaxID=2478468 RepID=A0A3P4B7G8_9BURK|nr:GntR family transcriptional regulator [Pigmentiphaga humi]VCU72237.1 HTH-type transcriptional repressor YvoA [Pigmentiphaga humi]
MATVLPRPDLNVIALQDPAQPIRLQSHTPLYAQITEILRGRILEGTYQPNQQMPSEADLMAAFDVSRITVRQALGNLQSEGLIFRIHGKGTFVSRPRAFQDLGSLQGFGTAMRQMGYETHSKVLSLRAVRPPQQVKDKLGLPKGAKVTELRRLRFLNREPISVDVSYLPTQIGVRLAKADLANRDVFSILENDFQIPLGYADLQMTSMLASEDLAAKLGVAEGSPILFIERVIHTRGGDPLEYEELYYRGDGFQFKVRVARAAE